MADLELRGIQAQIGQVDRPGGRYYQLQVALPPNPPFRLTPFNITTGGWSVEDAALSLEEIIAYGISGFKHQA